MENTQEEYEVQKEKIKRLCAAAGLLSLLLCGCQNADVDYGLDTEESEAQGISPLELESGETWEETLVTSDNREVVIKCSVKIPDVEKMSVVEVQRQELNEEYLKTIIKALYGSLEVYSNEEKSEVVTDFTKVSYYGTYLSSNYILNISEGDEGTTITFEPEKVSDIWPQRIEMDGSYIRVGVPEDEMFYESDYEVNFENQCEMSEEEAKRLAEETLNIFGWMPEWEEAKVCSWFGNVSYQYDPVHIYDGYCFDCSLGDGELVFGDFDTGYNLVADHAGQLLGEASVFVNDKGVLKVEVKNPVKLISMTDNVNLLSLDSIKGVIRKELSSNPDPYLSKSGLSPFYEMELNYIRVKDKERDGYYSYVPAWRLCVRGAANTSGERLISRYPVIVNAIDGSIINLEDVIQVEE